MNRRKDYYNLTVMIAMATFALFNISTQAAAAAGMTDAAGRSPCFLAAVTSCALPLLIVGIGGRFLRGEMTVSVTALLRSFLPQAALSCLFWWVLTALLYMRSEYPTDLDADTFFECLAYVLANPFCARIYHLVFSMVVFYPLLRKAAVAPKLMLYGAAVCLALCVLNPLLATVPYLSILVLFTKQINWNFFTVYALYLFMGMLVEQYEVQWHWRTVIYCLGGLSTVAIYTLTVVSSAKWNSFVGEWLTETSVFVVFQTLAVLVMTRQLTRKQPPGWLRRLLTEFGSCGYAFVALFAVADQMLSRVGVLDNTAAPGVMLLRLLMCLGICAAIGCCMNRLPGLAFLSNDPGENIE